jgi:hypothetical protein
VLGLMCKGSVVLLGSDVESLVTISSLLGCTGDMQQEPYQVRDRAMETIICFVNAVEADPVGSETFWTCRIRIQCFVRPEEWKIICLFSVVETRSLDHLLKPF